MMMSKPSEFDAHQRRPDFVVHLQVDENTTTRLFAYQDAASAVDGGDAGRQRTSVQNVGVGVGLGLLLNTSINKADFSSVMVPSTIQENDAEGAMYFSIAVILIYGISIAMLVAASTLRRNHTDYELKSFMRSYARLDVERRSLEKQRIRAALKRFDRLTTSAATRPGLVAVASAAPHAAVAVNFRPPAGLPSVRPAKLPGLGTRTPTESTWLDRSPPTVSVVDVSAGESYRDYDDSVDGPPQAAVFGSSATLHPHQKQQQQQPQPASHNISRLPRHLSELSLLVPKTNEFGVVQPSNRRNTSLE